MAVAFRRMTRSQLLLAAAWSAFALGGALILLPADGQGELWRGELHLIVALGIGGAILIVGLASLLGLLALLVWRLAQRHTVTSREGVSTFQRPRMDPRWSLLLLTVDAVLAGSGLLGTIRYLRARASLGIPSEPHVLLNYLMFILGLVWVGWIIAHTEFAVRTRRSLLPLLLPLSVFALSTWQASIAYYDRF